MDITATPQRNAENSTTEQMDRIQNSEENIQCLSAEDTIKMLRSRIGEQSDLIHTLKEKVDELFLRCQVLQKDNTELEGQVTGSQKELDGKRKRAELLEKRFVDLAANNQGIISSMEEYKSQNAQLKLENKHMQTENKTLFSQKLQDKQQFTQKLLEEIKLLTEKCTIKENEYGEKLAECKSKLLEQVTELQAKETSLLDQLRVSQKQQRDAEEMCKDLKLNLQKVEKEKALKEISLRDSITGLTKEKDKLLHLSMEKGKEIQGKQEEIQQLERKLKEEKKARVEAEDRFEREAEVVNANVKVKSLQSALDESMIKYGHLKKEFEAFKEHSAKLLVQERELNDKLRHIMG